MRVYFFGDSITQGFFDQKGGWAQRLANQYHGLSRKSMDEKDAAWIECFNLGVSGDTAEDLLGRMEEEVAHRQLSEEEETIVIAIGINDAVLRQNRVSLEVYDFQEIIERLLDKALKITDKVVCIGLTAVDESLTDPWKHSTTKKQWFNNRINLFEDTIKQACINRETVFVPVHDRFLAQSDDGSLLSDGLHPNEAGHELIAHLVKPELDRMLGL